LLQLAYIRVAAAARPGCGPLPACEAIAAKSRSIGRSQAGLVMNSWVALEPDLRTGRLVRVLPG
jgi:hypothetical protein